MSFEPIYLECLDCELYRSGDGKSMISRCLVEEGHEPPKGCPIPLLNDGLSEEDYREER